MLLQVFVATTQLVRRSRALASMLPALLQSGVLTLAMSAVMRVMWSGGNDFFGAWMEAWLTTWPLAFPLIYLLAALLRRLAPRQPARNRLPAARSLKPDTSVA